MAARPLPFLQTGRALPKMRAVAVRLPGGGSPRLFVHEGARQALERRLAAAGQPVTLAITDNSHAIVTHRSDRGVLRARVHHMFLDAPNPIIDALVRYVRHGDSKSSALIGNYIEENHARLARRSASQMRLVTKGTHHDLLAIFERLNERYFDHEVHALVSWGRRTQPANRRKGRRTIKLGSYAIHDRLIRIHPALDRRWVPRYFLELVMFHEMLHHVMPHTRRAGRRMLHPPEFRERERELRQYERAMAWERAHLARLLRA
jgi:hypothetical protein